MLTSASRTIKAAVLLFWFAFLTACPIEENGTTELDSDDALDSGSDISDTMDSGLDISDTTDTGSDISDTTDMALDISDATDLGSDITDVLPDLADMADAGDTADMPDAPTCIADDYCEPSCGDSDLDCREPCDCDQAVDVCDVSVDYSDLSCECDIDCASRETCDDDDDVCAWGCHARDDDCEDSCNWYPFVCETVANHTNERCDGDEDPDCLERDRACSSDWHCDTFCDPEDSDPPPTYDCQDVDCDESENGECERPELDCEDDGICGASCGTTDPDCVTCYCNRKLDVCDVALAYTNTPCECDPDCETREACDDGDGVCTWGCYARDDDCGEYRCNYYEFVCEALNDHTNTVCPDDPDCGEGDTPCSSDGHCDTFCDPPNLDPPPEYDCVDLDCDEDVDGSCE